MSARSRARVLLGGVGDAVGEPPPAGFVEPDRAICRGSAGTGGPSGRARVREDRPRIRRLGGVEGIERRRHCPQVIVERVRLAEMDRYVAADEIQSASLESVSQRGAVAEVAGGPSSMPS